MKTFFLLTNVVDYSFKYTEVLQIAKKYDKVFLVDFEKTKMKLPSNVTEWTMHYKDFNAKKVLRRNVSIFLSIFLTDTFLRSFNWKYLKNTFSNISFLLNSIYIAEQLKARIIAEKIDPKQSIFLSFWFFEWAISLGVLKKQKYISGFFSRAHGFDIFEYRVPINGRIPFRIFQLQSTNKIYSVSRNGEHYLKEKYPEFSSKIFHSYLGTEEGGINSFNSSSLFTIVSCASTRSLKRIYLIPEILKKCNFPIHWVHLGDENLSSNDPSVPTYIKNKESLKNYPHITFECKGKMESIEIFDFYKNNSIHLFISVSETEGLPVSIMEAISFGIPVISTDVGGCKEIVTEKTGILIPKDFELEKVAKQIEEFRASSKNTASFREGVRSFWAQNFEITKNYKEFFEDLESN